MAYHFHSITAGGTSTRGQAVDNVGLRVLLVSLNEMSLRIIPNVAQADDTSFPVISKPHLYQRMD